MCCCDKPTINGEVGYKWQPTDAPSIRQSHAPELMEGDDLLYDAPGRCGCGTDSHCHHYRVVKHGPFLWLLVQHGGGLERHRLGKVGYFACAFAALNEDERYWLFNGIYRAIEHARDDARANTETYWRQAAAEKRIKTRTRRESGGYRFTKVWIEPQALSEAHS